MAVFSALAFVLSSFLAIPYPGGSGYFNFADALTILASLLLGPIEGAFVGVFSGTMSDLYAGYVAYIPFTFLAKGLLGLLPGLLYNVLKKHKYLRYLGIIIAPACMVVTYMVAYYAFYGLGYLFNSLFDLAQGYGGAIIAAVLYFPIKKALLRA